MHSSKTGTFITLRQEVCLVRKFGWYGLAFFLIKGALWLIAPLIIYAVN